MKTPAKIRIERLSVRTAEGCLEWRGWVSHEGYGLVQGDDGRKAPVHRVYYEAVAGPIPAGLHLDHLCRNRACCEPSHLEAVTPRENWARSTSPTKLNVAKTHCTRGHPYDEANTYLFPKGTGVRRMCRACHLINTKESRARRRPVRTCSLGSDCHCVRLTLKCKNASVVPGTAPADRRFRANADTQQPMPRGRGFNR